MRTRRIIIAFLLPIRRVHRVVVRGIVVMNKQMLLSSVMMIAIRMMVMLNLECYKRAKPIGDQDRHHQGGGNQASEHGQQFHRRGGI